MSITKNELETLAKNNSGRKVSPEDVREILRSNPIVTMSWGTHQLTAFGNQDGLADALAFKVNGKIHKGWVLITLNFLDLFDIYLTKPSLAIGSTKGMQPTAKNVYIEDFMQTLDNLIETPN